MSARTLLVKELAEELGGSPGAYRKLFLAGTIPGDQRGRRVYFNAEEVREAIATAGVSVRGMDAAKSELDKRVDEIEQAARKAGISAALGHLRIAMMHAREDNDPALELRLTKLYTTVLEDEVGS